MKILIGKTFFDEFKSVYHLVSECPAFASFRVGGNCGSGESEADYDGCSVEADSVTYVFDSSLHGVELDNDDAGSSEQQENGFDVDGATWFAGLRGGKVNSAENEWRTFMEEKVASVYHTAYSIVEYKQSEPTAEERRALEIAKERAKKKTVTLMNKLYPRLQINSSKVVDNEAGAIEESVDVYGVIMRLSVQPGETGEAKRIIGKVYLRALAGKNGANVTLECMSKEEAQTVEQTFATLTEEQSNRGNGNSNNDISGIDVNSIRTNVLSKVQAIVDDTNIDFSDIFYVTGVDEEELRQIVESTSNNVNSLKCTELKVLCITHVKWKTNTFDVVVDGKPSFRVNFDLGDAITLRCLNCDTNNYIVKDDKIVVFDRESGKEIKQVQYTYDAERGTIGGIDPDDEELIAKSGLHTLHRFPVKCEIDTLGINCTRHRCISQVSNSYKMVDDEGIEVTVNLGENEFFCNDCQRKEFMTSDANSAYRIPTSTTVVATIDRMDGERKPIHRNKTGKCEFCGGWIEAGKMTYCSRACQDAANHSQLTKDMREYTEAKHLYRKYAQTLPLGKRFGFKLKLAFESKERVFLIVGDKSYQFDKLTVRSTGKLNNAVPIVSSMSSYSNDDSAETEAGKLPNGNTIE